MQANHLVIWFHDVTTRAGSQGAPVGFPEELFDSLCRGRVLEKRYTEEGFLCGAEVTFESTRSGHEFANALSDARHGTGTEPWIRGAEALAYWRTGRGLFPEDPAPRFIRQFFLEPAGQARSA